MDVSGEEILTELLSLVGGVVVIKGVASDELYTPIPPSATR